LQTVAKENDLKNYNITFLPQAVVPF